MTLSYNDYTKRYELASHYHERSFAQKAGFRWDRDTRQWWTKFEEKAWLLVKAADDECKERLEAWKAEHDRLLTESAARDAKFDVPFPEGLEPYAFQRAGIAFAAQRRNALIADEMGLGKTIQAIGTANAVKPHSVLVICPASVKTNWKREWDKWSTLGYEAGIATTKDIPMSPVVIVNYDILAKHAVRDALNARSWGMLIADEAHYCKNPKAMRTKMVIRLAKLADRKLFLTGTPILNRPVELWPLLKMLDPESWPKFFSYGRRYCNAFHNGFAWDFTGASHLDELQHKLRTTIMVRRLKSDVLADLPGKQRQVIEVDGGKPTAESLHLKELIEEMGYEDAVSSLRKVSVEFEEMSEQRREEAIAKAPAVVTHCQELLESVGKLVVFAHHREVVRILTEGLAEHGVVSVTGDTTQKARQQAVDGFQQDPRVKVFVGNIQSAGVGLTLTAASTVVFAELDWVPGNVTQAEDRCHRIGQDSSVLVQHLVVGGTIDATLAHAIVEKQSVLDSSLDGATGPVPLEGVKRDIPLAHDGGDEQPPQIRRAPGRLEQRLEAMPVPTKEAFAAAQRGLQTLHRRCDGAEKRDDCGFNLWDQKYKYLCWESYEGLRDDEKRVVCHLALKYHRQIPTVAEAVRDAWRHDAVA